MNARTAIFIGCLGVAILGTVIGGAIGVWLWHVAEDPEGLWITVEAPLDVQIGETFKLVVTASNRLTDHELELGDLDITDAYLKGFAIVSVSPDPKSTDIDTFNDCTTTRFAATVAPGSTARFEFELRAERVGKYRGLVYQYLGMQFVSAIVETTVSR